MCLYDVCFYKILFCISIIIVVVFVFVFVFVVVVVVVVVNVVVVVVVVVLINLGILRHFIFLFTRIHFTLPSPPINLKSIHFYFQTGVKYGSFNILTDDAIRQGLKTFSNWPTYPQLYANGPILRNEVLYLKNLFLPVVFQL